LSEAMPGAANDPDDRRNIHSFIVRVWFETADTEMEAEIWRGHIIALPGYERHYFSDIAEISAFIESYLKKQS
jgi:hypothetical protein